MATPAYRAKLIYEDYLLFPNDGRRHELIGGEHYVSPAPKKRHQRASGNLYRLLSVPIYEQRLGFLYAAPFDVVLSEEDVVQPDLMFISRERSAIEEDAGIFGAPDLIVEVLSNSTRQLDEVIKHRLYEWASVQEYWLVDPLLETVKVYRLTEGTFERVAELSAGGGGRLETPLLPGVVIPLEQIFE